MTTQAAKVPIKKDLSCIVRSQEATRMQIDMKLLQGTSSDQSTYITKKCGKGGTSAVNHCGWLKWEAHVFTLSFSDR